MCKNPKISETRPDPKISGFLRSDLRNLKFYEVKPGPTPTRIFGLGVFLGFLGFQVMLHTLPTHSEVWNSFREVLLLLLLLQPPPLLLAATARRSFPSQLLMSTTFYYYYVCLFRARKVYHFKFDLWFALFLKTCF